MRCASSREPHAAYLVSMHELASQTYERGQSDKARLKVIGMVLGLLEREAKLLGLDSEMQNHLERRDGAPDDRGAVFNLRARVEPLSAAMLKQIQELHPIEKPDHAKSAGGLGPVDD